MWLKMESFVAFIIFQAPVKRQLRSLAKKLKTLQTSLVHQLKQFLPNKSRELSHFHGIIMGYTIFP